MIIRKHEAPVFGMVKISALAKSPVPNLFSVEYKVEIDPGARKNSSLDGVSNK
jgi:hypothetical protein